MKVTWEGGVEMLLYPNPICPRCGKGADCKCKKKKK